LSEDDDEVEMFAESLRSRESRELTSEQSRFYARLKALDEEERSTPEDSEDRERVLHDEALVRRKIGAVEEEIGRRKKEETWPW
jgi:hypothetical protein